MNYLPACCYEMSEQSTTNSKMHIMKQVCFQNWNLHGERDERTNTTLVLFCVEFLFHVSEYVNSQNKRDPPAENPMLTHKESSHHIKASECYAVSMHRTNGSIHIGLMGSFSFLRP
jgi:hypothetical protein